jgi:hypothetical protein
MVVSLDSPTSSLDTLHFSGFSVVSDRRGLHREWWYVARSRNGNPGCESEFISIFWSVKDSALSSLDVLKSGEGWEPTMIKPPKHPGDSVLSCWSIH